MLNTADLNRLTRNDPIFVTLDLSTDSLESSDLNTLLVSLKDNNHLGRIKWPSNLPTDSESKAFKESIDQKLEQNNVAFKLHPTHYEYAVLSLHVYQTHKKDSSVNVYKENETTLPLHTLSDWHIEKWFDLNKKNGLYAALYVNP